MTLSIKTRKDTTENFLHLWSNLLQLIRLTLFPRVHLSTTEKYELKGEYLMVERAIKEASKSSMKDLNALNWKSVT